MTLFGKNENKNGGLMDVIRCDEQNYLIWKWHPEGAVEGESKRENSIRWGSSLRVKEGSVAVFVYSSDNGTVQDYIVGPADVIVDTLNLPVISSIIGLAYAGGSPFQAEVYFINLANTIQMKFAVPYFDVFDYELKEFSVPVAVRGSFDFNIEDYVEFIKKHRLDSFSLKDLQSQVRDSVAENVKSVVANAPDTYRMPVIHLEKKVADIKSSLVDQLTEKLFDSYGITLKDVNLEAIDIDKDSDGYKELESVTKKLTSDTLKSRNKAKNIAESRDIKGNQTINLFEKAANTFVDIKEKQFSKHKESEAKYSDVIEDKRAGEIGAIVGKLSRGIKGIVNKEGNSDVPPEIPGSVKFAVAINGKAEGPFDLQTLSEMVTENKLNEDSLVWRKGMKEWQKAKDTEELKDLFVEAVDLSDMPEIPKE